MEIDALDESDMCQSSANLASKPRQSAIPGQLARNFNFCVCSNACYLLPPIINLALARFLIRVPPVRVGPGAPIISDSYVALAKKYF